MKKLGILGGISYASTLSYYETLHRLFYARHRHYYYPEMVIESLNFQYFTDLENANRMEEYRRYILRGLAHLQSAGADVALLAANSPHSVLPDLTPNLPLPVVSILDAVGREARRLGLGRLLLTGIRYTMAGRFYPEGLREYGLEVLVPTAEEQADIDRIIFSELAVGQTVPASRERFLSILAAHPADGVILGCTELPQLVTQADTPIPLLDSLRLHCELALETVCGD